MESLTPEEVVGALRLKLAAANDLAEALADRGFDVVFYTTGLQRIAQPKGVHVTQTISL